MSGTLVAFASGCVASKFERKRIFEMAEEEVVSTDAKAGASKLVPILIGVILLLVVGFGAFIFMGKGGGNGGGEGGGKADSGGEVAADEVGPMHKIKGLVVNLNDPAGDRYLRASLEIELTGDKMASEFAARESRIRDQIITFLSSLRYAQTQGARGKEEIRKGITSQLNASLKSGKVRGVYFTEFVVQ
jgi:flagellar FliL protein